MFAEELHKLSVCEQVCFEYLSLAEADVRRTRPRTLRTRRSLPTQQHRYTAAPA